MHTTREVWCRLKPEIDQASGKSPNVNLVVVYDDEGHAAVQRSLLNGVSQSLTFGNKPIRAVRHETGVGVLCNTTNFIPFSMGMISSRFVYLCSSLPCLLASVV